MNDMKRRVELLIERELNEPLRRYGVDWKITALNFPEICQEVGSGKMFHLESYKVEVMGFAFIFYCKIKEMPHGSSSSWLCQCYLESDGSTVLASAGEGNSLADMIIRKIVRRFQILWDEGGIEWIDDNKVKMLL